MHQKEHASAWRQMFSDLSEFAKDLPSPPRRRSGDDDRVKQNDVIAVAVAWGWMQRVLRTSEAVVLLGENGFSPEAAPLRRAILEHAVRLNWAVEVGGDRLMELLLKSRTTTDEKYRKAAEFGFNLNEDHLAWLEQRKDEQSGRYLEDSHLAQMNHVFSSDLERYGVPRQGWLWETSMSHPTLDTADLYYSFSDDSRVRLLDNPKVSNPDRDVRSTCAYMLLAVEAYMAIVGLGEPHTARLAAIAERLSAQVKGSGPTDA